MSHTLTTIPSLKFIGHTWTNVRVEQSWYVVDQTVAIRLMLEDGDTLTTVTQNLGEYGLVPAEGCIFIKNYSEGEGLTAALQKVGIVKATGRTVSIPPFDAEILEARFLLPLVDFDAED